MATMSVGLISDPHQAEDIVAIGQADMVAHGPWASSDAALGLARGRGPRGRDRIRARSTGRAIPRYRPQMFPNRQSRVGVQAVPRRSVQTSAPR